MIHLGDITKIDGKRIEPVDVIVGGSPCQDLSVAGKRAGLAGERSGLFMEQIRLTKELRQQDAEKGKPDHLCRPRYFIWENVPGAFSSKKGEDFAAVLEEVVRVIEPEAPPVSVPEKGWPTAGCLYDDMGRWSVAWRVHDAQFWGVPQRRRRIALVADFGGLSAPEVLFERKGLRGDPAQSGEAWEGATADAEGSSGGASRTYNIDSYHSNAWKSDNPHSGVYETEVSKTLDALNCGYPACNQGGTAVVCMATQQGGAEVRADDRVGESAGAGGDGRLDAVSGGFCHESAKARSIGWGEELAPTLTAGAVPGVVSAVTLEPVIAAREGGHIYEGVCGTLRDEAGDNRMAVAYTTAVYDAMGNGDGETVCTITGDHENRVTDYTALCIGNGQADKLRLHEKVSAINCMHDQQEVICADVGFFNAYEQLAPSQLARQYKDPQIVNTQTVRRLTPLECERLQGFPSEKKVDVSKMTKDEYIAWNLAEKNIIADPEKGIVYATRGPGGIIYDEPKELKGTELNGYKVVSIRNGGTKLQCRVHRIIWISQNGIIPEGYCIDHINNDKQDNRISNLQLLTPQENSHKAKEDGLYLEGLDNKVTKLDPDLKDELCYLYHVSDLTQRELAEIYGISKSRVNQIIKEIGWTDIGEWFDSKGKRHESSDSARYKALGNSIALPFWHWLMRRISAQYVGNPTLGSLFDGISGFCLSWARCNGAKNCRWSSEIEEFPMAVTRKHFGDEKTGEVGDIEKYL